MRRFLTSDTHFNHVNLIEKFHTRPMFTTIKQHDKYLKEMWNDCVKPKDHVYHLGDFAWVKSKQEFTDLINQLHGYIYLIKGNHDRHIPQNIPKKFKYLGHYYELKFNKRKHVLCHYPFQTWNGSHYNTIHFHGHVHSNLLNYIPNRLNVCIDANDYKLLEFTKAVEIIKEKGNNI